MFLLYPYSLSCTSPVNTGLPTGYVGRYFIRYKWTTSRSRWVTFLYSRWPLYRIGSIRDGTVKMSLCGSWSKYLWKGWRCSSVRLSEGDTSNHLGKTSVFRVHGDVPSTDLPKFLGEDERVEGSPPSTTVLLSRIWYPILVELPETVSWL